MEAKKVMDIIDAADCNTETCFVASDKTLNPLGWARRLIGIAFKAGYDSRKEVIEGLMDVALKDGERMGRQEVVEWIESHEESTCMDCSCAFDFRREEWEAFKRGNKMKGDKLVQCQKCGELVPILYIVGNRRYGSVWLMVCKECKKEEDNGNTASSNAHKTTND